MPLPTVELLQKYAARSAKHFFDQVAAGVMKAAKEVHQCAVGSALPLRYF